MTDKEDLREATRDDLLLVLKLLNASGVEYMLVGGYALFIHGYKRATVDIDVLVPGNVDTGKKVIQTLMALPNQAAKDMKPEWFTEGGTIRVGDAFMVDVMTNANGHTYEALAGHLETIELNGVPVRTLDLQGLLLTKQTLRAKDAADRLVIERALAAMGHPPEPENAPTPPAPASGIVGPAPLIASGGASRESSRQGGKPSS